MGTYRAYPPQDLRSLEATGSEFAPEDRRRQGSRAHPASTDHQSAAQPVPGAVRGAWVKGQYLEFDLGSQVSSAFRRISHFKQELVEALGVSEMRAERLNGGIKLQGRRDLPHPVDLLDLLAVQPRTGLAPAVIGLDEEGYPFTIDFGDADTGNILVAGLEGAGKSNLLRAIAVSLALTCRQREVQTAIIAPTENDQRPSSQRRVLSALTYLPHLLFPVATTQADADAALEYLADEAIYRAEEGLTGPLIVALIDDVDQLLANDPGNIRQTLAELLDAPKEAGIRLVFTASDVSSPDLLRLVKFNVPLRLIGRMPDANRAFLISGEPDTGAENLNGSGDFLAVSYASLRRFQGAYIDNYDLHLTLTELHRPRRTVLLAQPAAKQRPQPAYKPVPMIIEAGDGQAEETLEAAAAEEAIEGFFDHEPEPVYEPIRTSANPPVNSTANRPQVGPAYPMTPRKPPQQSPVAASQPPPWKTVQSLPFDDPLDEGPSLVVEDREPVVTPSPKRDELQYEVVEDDWSDSDDVDDAGDRASAPYH